MLGILMLLLGAAALQAQTPDVLEGRKRMRELLAKTYVQCGKNDFRLVETRGSSGSPEFRIVEYETLSHMLNVLETDPENAKGVQYRANVEHSCARKRIYTLVRAGSQWRGNWSDWAPCGKADPDNPFELTARKEGEPTGLLKRAGAWAVTGAKFNTEPKPVTCEDVPPASGNIDSWVSGFLKRRGGAPGR